MTKSSNTQRAVLRTCAVFMNALEWVVINRHLQKDRMLDDGCNLQSEHSLLFFVLNVLQASFRSRTWCIYVILCARGVLSHPINLNLNICVPLTRVQRSTDLHRIRCRHLALYSTSIETTLDSVIMSLKNGVKLSFVTGNANKLKEVQAILLDSQGRLLEIEPKD